jgi:hypothetical protein
MQKYTDVVTSARSGAAIPNARVTVKTSPGAVTATIYSDDGVTTQDNPLTTDSNGEFTFYAADGEYTLTVSGIGLTERTVGPIILHDPADSDDYAQAADVSFTPSGIGGIAQSVARRLQKVVFVTDFIPVALHDGIWTGTNTTDLTAYIQAAIDALDTLGGGVLYFPQGVYKVTSTLTVAESGTHLMGAGMSATQINFAPTANDVCLEIANGASMVTRWSVSRMSFMSDDSTYTKTAIDVQDAGTFEIADVEVGGSVVVSSTQYWSGANSIGLRLRGKEVGVLRNLWITADRPILISENPNDSAKAVDHFEFNNMYLIANANPNIEVEDGCRLVNMHFTGNQAWVRGTYGFYWVDTQATAQNSANISFANIRTEQGTDTAAYSIYISLSGSGSSVLRDFRIQSSEFESGRHGFYFRNVRRVAIEDFTYNGASGKTSIDMTGIANSMLTLNNAAMGASTTATLTDLVRVMEARPTTTTYPIGEFAVYAATSRDGLRMNVVTSSNLAVAASANMDGALIVEDAGSNQRNLAVYSGTVRHRIRAEAGLKEIYDHFLGDVVADQWDSDVGSDPQVAAPAIVSAIGGLVRMTTGDDAAASMAVNGVQMHSGVLNWQAGTGGLMAEFKIKMSAPTDICVFFGFTDQVSALEMPFTMSGTTLTSNATDAVGLLFDTDATTDNWKLVGVAGDTDATVQDAGVAPGTNTYETWRITISTGGTANFYKNGTQVGSAMTGSVGASTALTPVIAAFSRGAASRNVDLDYVLVQQDD